MTQPTRKLHLFSATSLDGYIAREDGDISWLFTDQDYGYSEFIAKIGVVLMGRKTYEVCRGLTTDFFSGLDVIVFSRQPCPLDPLPPRLLWTDEDPTTLVARLHELPGKDLWIVGGAGITTELLQADLIDEHVVSIHPIILGGGVPLFATPFEPVKLKFQTVQSYPTGLVQIRYGR